MIKKNNKTLNNESDRQVMDENLTHYQKNREKNLNRAKEYYKNNKEAINEKRKQKYKELNDADKDAIKNGRMNRYNNMNDEAKMKLKEYRRNYYKKCKEQHAKEQEYIKNMQKEYENYNGK